MPRFDADYVPSSALTIFAHPDDAEFSCGGTLAAWARNGCAVTLVLCTTGNAGTHDTKYTRESLAETRATEQQAAAAAMGVQNVIILGHDDCNLVADLTLRRELVRLIRQHKPEVVVCGDPRAWFYGNFYINHPDHRAAASAALEAVFPCSEMELLWPEDGPVHKVHAVYVSGPEQSETAIDITDSMDAKLAALKCHVSQMGDWDPGDMIKSWAAEGAKAARKRARAAAKKAKGKEKPKASAGSRRKPKYVEGFQVMVLKQDD
jgi:LmbE family N-acetylglucosaminyl deacetylase